MKPKFFTTLILFLISVSIALSVSAKEIQIYVSPTGNDQNDGTLKAPLKTIEKASELVRVLRKTSPE